MKGWQFSDSSVFNSYFYEMNKNSTTYFAHESAIIDKGSTIAAGTKIWHFSHIMPDCIIGAACNIGQNVFIASKVVLGKNVKVQNNVSIYSGVICEDDVFLGPSMVFTNVINPRSHVNRKETFQPTIIRKGATIGANATIICGNEIGQYAMVGAGAVITKAIKPFALVVGNPAKQIGWVSKAGNKLNFGENSKAVCKETGQIYELIDGEISIVEK